MTPRRTHLAGIEGVRGLAAAAVVLYHVRLFAPSFRNGTGVPVLEPVWTHLWLGVTVFFVLSGFLLYRPYAAASLRGEPAPRLGRYARKRLLRIVPAYWVALAVSIVLFHPLLLQGPAWGWVRQFLFLQIYFPRTTEVAIGPAWTLCIEVTFYAALPALAWAVARVARGGARRHAAAIAPLVAVGTGYGFAQHAWPGLPLALPEFIGLFAIGMLLAVAHESGALPSARRLLLASLATGLVALPFAHPGVTPTAGDAARTILFVPLMATAFAFALGSMLAEPGARLARFCSLPALTGLGGFSYGLYLWHEPLLLGSYNSFVDIEHHLGGGAAVERALSLPIVALLVAAAVACAWLSWQRLEQPLLRRKREGGLEPLDHGRDRLAEADAHAGDAVAGVAAIELV